MNMSTTFWIIATFAVYMGIMLAIGAVFTGRLKNSEDYFLGGRSLGGWVAAMSAQASDMSGWLLMGLPGAIYAAGTGQIWIGVGLAIGTALNWIFVSKRLRRYAIAANNAVTIPQYFENRFNDKTKVLRTVSSLFIFFFFLIYTASGFNAGAKLFSSIFNMDYQVALIVGTVIIVLYTFLGGFLAVCWTDFIQGMLMLAALLIVPIAAVCIMDGNVLNAEGITGDFLNPLNDGNGGNFNVISIISQLGWALGYFGMPHILVRFMAIRNDSEVKKSRIIAIVWVVLSLAAACLVGIVGKGYLSTPLEGADTEKVFIKMIMQMFTDESNLPIVAGVLLCGILAAIMSTADSQLLVSASSISEDIVKGLFFKNMKDKTLMILSRLAVILIAVIAYFIARNPDNKVMDLVSNAWAGFGAAFGPTVLLSLYWKRTNAFGAAMGIISGGGTVILWDYAKIINGQTLGEVTGLYSLVVGFAVSLVFIWVFTLLSQLRLKNTENEVFDAVAGSESIEEFAAVHGTAEAAVEETAEEAVEEAVNETVETVVEETAAEAVESAETVAVEA